MRKIILITTILGLFLGCSSKAKIVKHYDSSKIEQKAKNEWSKL